jgi:hypothetical protein
MPNLRDLEKKSLPAFKKFYGHGLWCISKDIEFQKFQEYLESVGFQCLDSGDSRIAYQRGNVVIKVPRNTSGIVDNDVESCVWHLYKNSPTPEGFYLAPCRLLKNGALMMVAVDTEDKSDPPAWAENIDGCQVGLYKQRHVAYDYALDVNVPDELAKKYFGIV